MPLWKGPVEGRKWDGPHLAEDHWEPEVFKNKAGVTAWTCQGSVWTVTLEGSRWKLSVAFCC